MHCPRRVLALCTVVAWAAASGCQGVLNLEYHELDTICSPGAARCGATARQICDADGLRWEDAPCDPARPSCTGAGECVCMENLDEDACTRDHCENGDLVENTLSPDRPCELWQGTPSDTSCARDGEGGLRCWGGNTLGELGQGSTDASPHVKPVKVTIPPVRSFALGAGHGCALLRDGTVQCWGRNDFGQAGGAIPGPTLTPLAIALPGPVRQVATGGEHGCALLEDGAVWCWGHNQSGQLGDGTQVDRATPVPLLADASTVFSGVTSVALGANQSCALLDDGAVWCWGDSIVLGDGSKVGDPPRLYPVWILGGIKQLSSGVNHACALGETGEVWCWGLSISGETGDPDPKGGVNSDVTTSPWRIDAAFGAQRVSAAFRHSCSTRPDGVWCWGGDFWGQLGNGGGCVDAACGFVYEETPQKVSILGPVDELATAFLHSCAIAQGQLSCWGPNVHGQLGNGTTDGADVPTLVFWE